LKGLYPLHNIPAVSFEGVKSKGKSKRGEASLKQPIPLPLDEGKGTKGMGLPDET